jgi:hypothetical protein
MLTSIWYHMGDKTPTESDFYLAYKLPTIGDDDEGYGLYYWSCATREWRDGSHAVKISYWTECPADTASMYEYSIMPTVAEIDAWNNVEDAVSKYNMVKELAR